MGQPPSITIFHSMPKDMQGSTVSYEQGQTLAQAVYLSGLVSPPSLCSGIALCGRCRLRIASPQTPPPLPEDTAFFTREELQAGWRLGCRHYPEPDMHIFLPENALPVLPLSLSENTLRSDTGSKTVSVIPPEKADYLLAVDLGTTSMEWLLIPNVSSSVANTATLPPAAVHGHMRNPQLGAGGDVISRLAAAQTPSGKKRLQALVCDALRRITASAAKDSANVSSICLAANPAMTALALGADITGLARAPYSLPVTGKTWESISELPPIWIPPQLSPFVGGDISAGYASILWAKDLPAEYGLQPQNPSVEFPFLLADLGTNGEFLLALSPNEAITASVALGPALEGIGLRCGTEARAGAVTAFSLTPLGLSATLFADSVYSPIPVSASGHPSSCPCCTGQHPTIMAAPLENTAAPQASGITGAGYVSLLHILLSMNGMSKDGAFTLERNPLLKKHLRLIPPQSTPSEGHGIAPLPTDGPSLKLPYGLFLTAADVEEILKVKAAFSLGLHRLLDYAGLSSTALRRVYVAGALGRHADKRALETLGFFPQGISARMTTVGNASLYGAALLVQSEEKRMALALWSDNVRSLDLATDTTFKSTFSSHMRFAW